MPLGTINPFSVGRDPSAAILGAAPSLITNIVAQSSAQISNAANNAIRQENVLASGIRADVNRADRRDEFGRQIFESDRSFIDQIVQQAIGNDQNQQRIDIARETADVQNEGRAIRNDLDAFTLSQAPELAEEAAADRILGRQIQQRTAAVNEGNLEVRRAEAATRQELADQRLGLTNTEAQAELQRLELEDEVAAIEAVPESERTATQKANLARFSRQLSRLNQTVAADPTVAPDIDAIANARSNRDGSSGSFDDLFR